LLLPERLLILSPCGYSIGNLRQTEAKAGVKVKVKVKAEQMTDDGRLMTDPVSDLPSSVSRTGPQSSILRPPVFRPRDILQSAICNLQSEIVPTLVLSPPSSILSPSSVSTSP
jgi:hypothetical protein